MAEQWDQFARLLDLHTAPAEQRKQMRWAFYAGAQAVLNRIVPDVMGSNPEPEVTEQEIDTLQGVHDELLAFAKLVKEGRA